MGIKSKQRSPYLLMQSAKIELLPINMLSLTCNCAAPDYRFSMIKKITIDQVRQGMYVHALGGSWLNNPFWAPSFALDSHELVHKLKNCGVKDLQIDLTKGIDVAVATEAAPVAAEAPRAPAAFRFQKVQPTGMVDELHHAARLVLTAAY